MGIFKRATDIVRSNINSMLDSLEDPSKIAELTISDAKESYVKLKKDSTEVVAVAISTEKQYKAALQDAVKWHEIAKKALTAGNETDARQALENENKAKQKASDLEGAYKTAKAESDRVQNALTLLQKRIADLEGRKDVIKAKATTAKIKQKAASLDFTGATGALDKFNRMEEKADKELAKAEAMEQMNANEHAEADSAADLMAKYSYGSGATDASLDALKAEMGLGGADDSDADIEALKAELDK